MRVFAGHPYVQTLAAVCAVLGIVLGFWQWRWHLSDERAAAIQLEWLAQDKKWNAEIIQRLKALESASVGPCMR